MDVVRDHQGRHAALRQAIRQTTTHGPARGRVQRREGLVQKQHARLNDQRAGQGDPLALSARQGLRPPLVEMAGAQLFQHGQGGSPGSVVAAGRARQSEPHVVDHAQVREESVALGHVADPALLRGQIDAPPGVEQDVTTDRDGPARRPVGSRDGAQEGGLAGAVGTDQRDRPLPALQAHVQLERADLHAHGGVPGRARRRPAALAAHRRPGEPPAPGGKPVSAAHRRPTPAATATTTRPRRPPGSARNPSSRSTAAAASTSESATAACTSDSSAV